MMESVFASSKLQGIIHKEHKETQRKMKTDLPSRFKPGGSVCAASLSSGRFPFSLSFFVSLVVPLWIIDFDLDSEYETAFAHG
jgi:hypothetical protein